jgi:hypothetical protein
MLRGAFGVTLFGILMTPVLCLDGVQRTAGHDGPRRPGARIRPGLVSGR